MTAPSVSAELVRCRNCGRRNRVPAAASGIPRCGNCHQPLPWIAEVAEAASVPVVVDLWAPWCGPCRMVSPALEEVAATLADRVKLVKVNVDASPRIQQRFEVRAIPTLIGHAAGPPDGVPWPHDRDIAGTGLHAHPPFS